MGTRQSGLLDLKIGDLLKEKYRELGFSFDIHTSTFKEIDKLLK